MVMMWTVWKPRDSDQAKIGLASGQPSSDTKAVGAGFLGHKIPGITPHVITSPRITVTGGHVLVTDYQEITGIGYKTIKV
jgi:hypothetical protein